MTKYRVRLPIADHTKVFVPLTGAVGAGRHLIVDGADWPLVSQYVWHAHRAQRSRTLYAKTNIDGGNVLIHRLIMEAEKGQIIDHIDGDGLNNSRANLRFVTQAENIRAAGPRRAIQKLFDRWEPRL